MFKISEDMIDLNVGSFSFSESEQLRDAEEKLGQLFGGEKMSLEEKDRFGDFLLTIKNECISNGFRRGFYAGYELSKEISELRK